MEGLTVGEFYSTLPAIGFGYRRVIIYDKGTKLISVCCFATATVVRVPIQSVRSLGEDPKPDWRRIRRILKRRIANHKLWGWETSKAAKALLKRLSK